VTSRLTDRRAIKLALFLARDTEDSMIDAYTDKKDPAVLQARKNIAAFERVLNRYFDGARPADLMKSAKIISVSDMLRGKFD